MSYIAPAGDSLDFTLSGAYTPPAGSSLTISLGGLAPVIAATEIAYLLSAELPIAPVVMGYGITSAYVTASNNIEWATLSAELTASVDLDWSYYVQGVTIITLPETADVINATTIAWRNAWEISRGVAVVWDGYGDVIGAVELGWDGVDEVVGSSAMVWNLESQTPVIAPVDLLWSAAPAAAQLPLSITLTYDDQAAYLGEDITGTGSITSPSGQPGISGTTGSGAAAGVTGGTVSAGLSSVTNASLRFDRREYAYRATLTLADPAEYLACPVGTAIEFAVGGTTIRYRVVDRARERSDLADGGYRYTLHLSSPAAWLDKPYARPVADDPAGMAATIATALASPLDLDWLTVNWPIAADLLPAAGRTPLDLLRTVAGTVGAVVRSEADGGLSVEPEYPVSLPDWPSATPDYYIDEAAEVFSAGEDEDQRDRVNAVLVSNQVGSDNAGTILIEVGTVEDDELLRELRVYVVPWNPTVTLRHTDALRVQLRLVGFESRLETELVEIVDGIGRTRYPIASVSTTDYMTVDLGAIEWTEAGEITTDTAAESLIEITYTTRCRMWTLASPFADPVQVVAEAPDQSGGTSGITVLVTRGDGDRQGDDVFDQLIYDIPAAMERGRNIIDAGYSNRAMVQLVTPAVSYMRPGSLIEVRDMEIPAWRGLLQAQEIRLEIGDTLVAESILEIEREVV